MSGTIRSVAAMYAEFADGQAQGAIVPGDVRDLIASVANLVGSVNEVITFGNGNLGSSHTINPANGHTQTGTLNLTGVCTLTVGAGDGVVGNRLKMELYLIQGSSGGATVVWNAPVTFNGISPQPYTAANATTLFNLVSLNGGTSWNVSIGN